MLNKQLTHEEKSELLYELFGFTYDDDVLIDDDGNEFYGYDDNSKFDFSTLGGIINYVKILSKKEGYIQAQINIKKALGIFSN